MRVQGLGLEVVSVVIGDTVIDFATFRNDVLFLPF